MRILGLVAALAAAMLLSACGGETTGGGEETVGGEETGGVTVTAQNFAFDPQTIDAEAGETLSVTLDNQDSVAHTFTVEALGVDLEVEGGASGTTEVTVEENVEFFCRIHPQQMRGEISVGGATGSDATTEDQEPAGGGGGNYDY